MLIKTIQEFKQYIPNLTGNKMPPLAEAEGEYIAPILGETLYASFNEKYNSTTPLNTAEKGLLQVCQAVVAPAALWYYFPFLLTTVGDSGLQQLLAENSTKPMKWEYNYMREELIRRTYAAQELLITFLKLNKSSFPEWNASPYNSTEYPALLRDGSDLRNIISLQQPNRCFLLLKSTIADVTLTFIEPLLSTEYYTVLQDRIVADTLTADDKVILPKVKMALIRKVLATAAQQMNVRLSENGFTIVQQVVDNKEEGRTNATGNQLDRFMQAYEKEADALSISVRDYLNANASESKYPEYFGSSVYQAPYTGEVGRISNEGRGLFIGGQS